MVKFSKQFEGQLVPEWKHAFVDYCLLKKDLKRMKHALGHDHCQGLAITQQSTRQRQPSSLSHWLLHKLPFIGSSASKDHGVIQVHRKLTGSASRGDVYETELLEQSIDTEAAREFFARLDAQLNKVNQFYKDKEEEFLERGESLRKQMEILVELKATFSRQHRGNGSSQGGGTGGEDPSVSCPVTSGEFF